MEKKNNGLLVFLVVIMFLIIIGLCVFIAYDKEIIFNNDKETTENKDNNDDVNKNEETEITSVILQRELEKDVKIIEGALYATVSAPEKGFISIDRLNKKIYEYNFLQLSDLNNNDAMTYSILYGYRKENFMGDETFDASMIQEKYNSLFGTGNISYKDLGNCGSFYYNEGRFFSPEPSCGGTNPIISLTYINRYTTDGNHAYAYVNFGWLVSIEETILYTDYKKTNIYTGGEKEINANNYKEFSEYKYTFDINEDGTYRFNKMEKIK